MKLLSNLMYVHLLMLCITFLLGYINLDCVMISVTIIIGISLIVESLRKDKCNI